MAKKKVLIIEDEANLVKLMRFDLELEGLECLVARDGIEGLAKARNEKPDLIIMDIMLPQMSGYEVTRQLKGDEGSKSIPIIMVTALAQEKDRSAGRESGADEYIVKPFDQEQLTALIKQYLGLPA